MRFAERAVRHYLRRNDVEGWLHPFSANVITDLSLYQIASRTHGAVCEIGIHHGKLFFLLYLTTRRDETAVAVDVFDLQHLNVDHSGKGDKAIFLKHARRWSPSLDGLRIIEGSSLDLRAPELVETGPIRLFSIDGSHTTEATISDLRLACASIADSGVVIVDDCFNEYWPEVCAGVAKFLSDRPYLVPWAMTPGKVFLCRPEFVAPYTRWIESAFRPRLDKRSVLFGYPVSLVGMRSMTPRARFGQTSIGKRLKALRDLIRPRSSI
jgi:hypothetical protein